MLQIILYSGSLTSSWNVTDKWVLACLFRVPPITKNDVLSSFIFNFALKVILTLRSFSYHIVLRRKWNFFPQQVSGIHSHSKALYFKKRREGRAGGKLFSLCWKQKCLPMSSINDLLPFVRCRTCMHNVFKNTHWYDTTAIQLSLEWERITPFEGNCL